MTRPVTQEDIARKLNVTRITVSKALRDHPDVSESMKRKVKEAAGEMGYSPNEIARQLTSRTTHTIGVIVPDLENSFFSHAVDSIIDAATGEGYQVLLAVSRENREIEERNIRSLTGMRVDGLLACLSQETTGGAVFSVPAAAGIPLVFFDRALPGEPCSRVVFDDARGVRQAIDHMAVSGYTRIAHLAGYTTTNIGRERRDGYLEAMERNGLIAWKEWVIEGGYEVDDGYRSFMQLYRQGNLPEIVMAVNDRVALGAYRACRELELRIPEDIGVAAFGFPETTSLFNPPLAVVAQDPRTMGRTAFARLLEEIRSDGKPEPEEIRIPEEFQWNESIKLKR